MHGTTEPPSKNGTTFSQRVARTARCVVEHDRRTWDRLMQRAAAEERWVWRSIKALFRPSR